MLNELFNIYITGESGFREKKEKLNPAAGFTNCFICLDFFFFYQTLSFSISYFYFHAFPSPSP
jgi:hypothetical protein